jgi:hypothetical protein
MCTAPSRGSSSRSGPPSRYSGFDAREARPGVGAGHEYPGAACASQSAESVYMQGNPGGWAEVYPWLVTVQNVVNKL